MASCLIELIAPGIGSPVVVVLQMICTIVKEMQECNQLCKRVYERLAFIYKKLLEMEKKRTLPSDEILQTYGKLVGDYKSFLKKHKGKKWTYRVVTFKSVLCKISDFQGSINTDDGDAPVPH